MAKLVRRTSEEGIGPSQLRILAAAEDLFAASGYEGTSIRQIAQKAGFGGKLGVYRRVFESHAPTIVAERRAGLALAELEQDRERRLAAIVKAVLVPMLKLRTSEGRQSLGRLLARELSDPRSRSCPSEWCSNGEAVVISGRAGSIKLPLRAA